MDRAMPFSVGALPPVYLRANSNRTLLPVRQSALTYTQPLAHDRDRRIGEYTD